MTDAAQGTAAAAPPTATTAPALSFGTPRGRWVLLATVTASGMAMLDGTVVNVAMPEIGRSLDSTVSGLQWVLNGYLLATASLILLGGSLGDMFGRRRVFLAGVVLFGVASTLCGLAPTATTLILARVLQGVGGAFLTPGSLAILQASFRPEDRGSAIGAWSGLSGVAGAIGPFVGGWLVDAVTWRSVFFVNIPVTLVVVAVTVRHVPESRSPTADHRIDVSGALLITVALATLSWGLIAAGDRGWGAAPVAVSLVASVVAIAAFAVVELRGSHPMLPPTIFASGQFRATNLLTIAVYAGLGVVFFLLVLQLQQVLGYSALEAGAATLPITLIMMAMSSWSGRLAGRIGPRLQLSVGPLTVALGLAMLANVGAGDRYATAVLPGVLLVGLGLATTVAPLTTAALASVDDDHAGVASGVNTTVARAAQLAAVAAVPVVAGITGDAYLDPDLLTDGFHTGMLIGATLVAVGGIVGFLLVRNPTPEEAEALDDRRVAPMDRFCCGVDGPPLDQCPRAAELATQAS